MNESIALGFGDNIDYELIWDSKVMESFIRRYDIQESELDINQSVIGERDLIISILSFLKSGSGGERIVASSEILENFSKHFDRKITLGGTPVRAALAMRKFGLTSALHLVTINDHIRKLLPQNCPYVCSSSKDSLHPHVIVQFDKGTTIKANDLDICAPEANRIIYHHDDDNMTMQINEDFADLITQARVLLVSGFNAMTSKILLEQRLHQVKNIINKLPPGALVFYEDAGYHDPALRQLLFRALAGKLSIVSLNEDELQGQVGQKLDLLNPLDIKDALVHIQQRTTVPLIVVHSRYWALAYGDDATRFEKALKGGTTMATTRFCYGDEFTVENYKEIEAFTPVQKGAGFAAELQKLLGQQVCCVPVAEVNPSNATTIGLGDAFVGGFLSAL